MLSALRVPLNERRLSVVDAAFFSIADVTCGPADGERSWSNAGVVGSSVEAGKAGDRRSAAAVALHDATARMHPAKHPQVVAGRLTAQQAREGLSVYVCVLNWFHFSFRLVLFRFVFS